MLRLLLFIKRIGLFPKSLSWIIDAEEHFIIEYDLTNVPVRSKPKIPVKIKILSKDKLPNELLKIQTLEENDLCCFAEYHNQIIHYTFATFKIWNFFAYNNIKFYCKLGSAYLFNSFTRESYRRMGIALAVREALLHHLKERGIKKAYVTVLTDNHAALKLESKIKCGRAIGRIRFFKLFNFATYNCKLEQNKSTGLIITR